MTTPADRVLDLDDLDHILLSNVRSPGVCKLNGFGLKPKWDVKDADGQTGASSSLKGMSIRQGSIDFFLGNDGDGSVNDFAAWEDFERLIYSSVSGTTPVALQIYHPDLARANLTAVCLGPEGVSLPMYDGRGGATYSVSFIEYKPPKPKKTAKAVAKPSSSYAANPANDVSGYGTREKPDPNQAAKDELAALTQQASQP
jgi:hypothetical protein